MNVVLKMLGLLLGFGVASIECAPPPKIPQTPADRNVLQTVMQQVQEGSRIGYTQSEAYLTIKMVQDKLNTTPWLDKDKKIIMDAMAKERELKNDYYVFYTAIPHMRLLQDITRKLYKKTVGNVGALQDKAFQFIRYTYNDPLYNQYKNSTEFLTKEITESGIIDDNDVRLKALLLSVNIAFFGNIHSTGESTWHYFNNPQAWVSVPLQWIEASLTSFGYPRVYAKKFLTLAPLTQYAQGELFQIFVPKNTVDDIGYLSWRQGIPFDVDILTSWFGRTTLGIGSWILHDEIKERVYKLRRQWKAGDESVQDQVALMLEQVKLGVYRLSDVLDDYKLTGPKNTEDMQARLLITNAGLLNPQSGIKIYRYSNLPAGKLSEYKKKL